MDLIKPDFINILVLKERFEVIACHSDPIVLFA